MTYNVWLCPKQNRAIPLDECRDAVCDHRAKCPVHKALVESDQKEVWKRDLPFHHAWTSAIINLSLRTMNRSKRINLPELQKSFSLIKGIIAELDVPNCGYRGYFFMQDGQAIVLNKGVKPDCVMLTSWQVLRQLYKGWTVVYDYEQQKHVRISYNPELAFNWDHIQLVKQDTDKNVLSAAYLFADVLYNVAFPIIREEARLKNLI